MSIGLEKIAALVKRMPGGVSRSMFGQNPLRDWLIVLTLACVLLVTLLVVGVSAYVRTSSLEGEVPQDTTVRRLPADPALLKSTYEKYRARDEQFERLRHVPLAVPDTGSRLVRDSPQTVVSTTSEPVSGEPPRLLLQ